MNLKNILNVAALLCLSAAKLSAQVYVTGRTPGLTTGPAGANTTTATGSAGTLPIYTELAGAAWSDTSGKSSSPTATSTADAPVRPGARIRTSVIAGMGFSVQPVLPTAGGTYDVEICIPNQSINTSTDITVSMTAAEGCSIDLTSTTAFRQIGGSGGPHIANDVWRKVCQLTCNPGVNQPKLTFTYASGAVGSSTRFYSDSVKFTYLGPPAAERVWNGNGGDNNWNTTANWVGGTAPALSGDAVIFAGSTRLTPNMEADYSVAKLVFNSGAGAFNIGSSGNILTLAGPLTNNSTAVQTLSLPVIVGGNQGINAASGNIVLSGVIGGSAGFTKLGANTLTLGALNTITGPLTLSAGVITVNSGAALCGSTAGLIVNGGTLNLNNAEQTVASLAGSGGTVNLAGSHTLTVNNPTAFTYSGSVAGTGSFMKSGAGILTLTSFNATGPVTVTDFGGQVRFSNVRTFNQDILIGSGGTLGLFNSNGMQIVNSLITGFGSINRSITTGAAGDSLFTNPDNTFAGGMSVRGGFAWFGVDSTDYPVTKGPAGTGIITIGDDTGPIGLAATNGTRIVGNDLVFEQSNTNATNFYVRGSDTLRLTGAITLNPTTSKRSKFIIENTNTPTVIDGIISGGISTSPFEKAGAGVLRLGGDNSYQGTTLVSTGIVQITASERIPNDSALSVSTGAIFDLNGFEETVSSLAGAGRVTNAVVGTTNLLTVGSDQTSTTFSGIIGGPIRLVKNGFGVLSLTTGVNGHTGGTVVNEGTVRVNHNTALGAANTPVSLADGVTLSTSTTTARALTHAFTVNGNITIGQAVGGTAALTLAGTVNLGGDTRMISVANSADTISAVISNGALIVAGGSGTLNLTGANTYSGITTVNSGKLLTTPASIGAGSYSVAAGASLAVRLTSPGSSLSVNELAIGSSTNEFDFANMGFSNSVINVAGDLVMNGDVQVDVKGFDTTGSVTLIQYSGTRNGFGEFILGLLPPRVTATITEDLVNKKVILNVLDADSLLWVSDANGNWDVNNGGNPIWKLPSTADTYYQENSIQGDSVRFDDTATGVTTVNHAETLRPFRVTVDNSSKDYIFSSLVATGKISGVGSLIKSGSGDLMITTTNDFSGGTILNAGKVTLGNNSVFGTGRLTINGGAIRSDSVIARTVSVPVTLNGNLAVGDVNNNGNLTFATGAWTVSGAGRQINVNAITNIVNSVISGTGGLEKTGDGTLDLGGANTFTGGVTVSAGTVRVNNNASLGLANSLVNLADGVTIATTAGTARTLTYAFNIAGNVSLGQTSIGTAAVTLAGTINLNGANRTFTVINATDTISGVISNGGITKDGTGILVISSAANTYSGPTTINAGQISISGTSILGDGTGIVTLAGGKLTSTATRTASTAPVPNPISLSADSEITTTSTAATVDLNLTGILSGSAGTLTFRNDAASGTGTFDPRLSAGNFTFNRPIVVVNNTNGTSSTRLSFFNTNGTVQTFNGEISGSGSVRRSASTSGTGGVTIFTAANSYGGGTIINDGTLLINNTTGSGTGSGAVTVNTGGTLGGTGTVAGPVTINSGGSIAAGASAGELKLQNGLNLSAGGTNIWELAANSTANFFDRVTLTGGDLVLDGTARVLVKFTGTATFPDSGNAFWQSARTWKIISLTGTAANPGSSNFIAVEGTEGNNAGTFSTSVDANGVYLNFTPGATPPAPVIDSQIVGAGTTNAQLSWSSVNGANYQVQYKTNLNQAVWQVLTNITATGSSTTISDNTSPVPSERYYQIVAQ